jgi:hypothetical protein
MKIDDTCEADGLHILYANIIIALTAVSATETPNHTVQIGSVKYMLAIQYCCYVQHTTATALPVFGTCSELAKCTHMIVEFKFPKPCSRSI